jgi:hypothetical protein
MCVKKTTSSGNALQGSAQQSRDSHRCVLQQYLLASLPTQRSTELAAANPQAESRATNSAAIADRLKHSLS